MVVIEGLIVALGMAGDKNDGKSLVFCRLDGRESDKVSSKDVSVSCVCACESCVAETILSYELG